MQKHIVAVMEDPLSLLPRREKELLVLTSVVAEGASLISEVAAVEVVALKCGVMTAFQVYEVELVLCLDVAVAFQVSESAVVVVLATLLFLQVGVGSG